MADCSTCCGNGEIVTDWERYLHSRDGDVGDEAVADCPDCDGTGESGDTLVLYSSRGWALDIDGWWSRPVYARDSRLELIGGRGDSCHAFVQTVDDELRLYCRNAKQKRRLDQGQPV